MSATAASPCFMSATAASPCFMGSIPGSEYKTYSITSSDSRQSIHLLYISSIEDKGKTVVVKVIDPKNLDCSQRAQLLVANRCLASIELESGKTVFKAHDRKTGEMDISSFPKIMLQIEGKRVEAISFDSLDSVKDPAFGKFVRIFQCFGKEFFPKNNL